MGQCCSRETAASSSFSDDYPDYQQIPLYPYPQPKPQFVPTTRTSSSSPEFGTILNKPYTDISTLYHMERELGRGQFGITYSCVEKSTGIRYACKSISRHKISRRKDIEGVRREIMILEHLSGQPNVVEFKGAYEDRSNLYLVMELCSGGELFDRITSKGSYSEKEAAVVFRQIVNVVHVCHFMGVVHRDLKPENFLLVDKHESSPLKIIDFGLSVFIEEDKVYKELVGSSYYVAPEVLQRRAGREIDVWSAGVILYILLSGVPPFWAESERGVFEEILKGHVDMESEPWHSVSSGAKDLINRMLTRDPSNRISAAEALEHPWLREGGEAPDRPFDNAVYVRIKQFRVMNKLKKLALKVLAENLSEEELVGVREMFNNLDTDRSGTITIEELRAGLARLRCRITEYEIQKIMDAVDVDKSGSIDYVEFITATMHRHRLDKEENLRRVFRYFDEDDNGYITREELRQAMNQYGMGDEAAIDEVLRDVDTDKDGTISYEEFVSMMKKGTTQSSTSKG